MKKEQVKADELEINSGGSLQIRNSSNAEIDILDLNNSNETRILNNIDLNNKTIKNVPSPSTSTEATNKNYVDGLNTPAEYNAGNSATAITITWTNGPIQKVTMTGNCTFTLSTPVTGTVYLLKLVQDATGGRTYTWPASVKWSGGTAPTGSGANKTDLINLYWDGTNYFGSYSLNY